MMPSMKTLKLWIFSLCIACFVGQATHAMQMERTFPVGVKRGKLSTTALAEIVIDGKLRQATAGLRIYSDHNLFITLGSIDVRNIMINYTQNEFGEIEKIWVLTLDEASVPIPTIKK
jgi:hypothetical protein